MTLEDALELVASQRVGALVTMRRNGRPQTSNVVYAVRGDQIRVSLTEDRAKTKNLQHDPRATLHVSTPDLSAWAAVEGDAELSPVTATAGDETGRALARLYVDIAPDDHQPLGHQPRSVGVTRCHSRSAGCATVSWRTLSSSRRPRSAAGTASSLTNAA